MLRSNILPHHSEPLRFQFARLSSILLERGPNQGLLWHPYPRRGERPSRIAGGRFRRIGAIQYTLRPDEIADLPERQRTPPSVATPKWRYTSGANNAVSSTHSNS